LALRPLKSENPKSKDRLERKIKKTVELKTLGNIFDQFSTKILNNCIQSSDHLYCNNLIKNNAKNFEGLQDLKRANKHKNIMSKRDAFFNKVTFFFKLSNYDNFRFLKVNRVKKYIFRKYENILNYFLSAKNCLNFKISLVCRP
jgi:hypothetical protein